MVKIVDEGRKRRNIQVVVRSIVKVKERKT